MELQELADRQEIADVLVSYTRAVDTGEWDRLDRVFTPDAEIDYVASGGIAGRFPEVKAWLAEVLPAFFPARMHTLGQLDVSLAGDAATVTAYFHNPMPAGEGEAQRIVEFGGYYHHDMIRTADGWRSRKLTEEIVWKRDR